MIRRGALATLATLLCVALVFAQHPKNVILMIGDGMGVAQVTAGRTHKGSLELEQFPAGGLAVTHAAGDDYITDSAAGATAYASGVKTSNGMLGMKPDKTRVTTVAELAASLGKRTGIVATCSVTHATPAAFLAHVESRGSQFDIAEQIAAADVNVLLGGGWGWFLPTGAGGRRTDAKDLLAEMRTKGFTSVSTPQELELLDLAHTEKLVGLFADNHVGPAPDRNPSLSDMTAAALSVLERSEKGFFLMVEGSQIDWASHENKSDETAAEMADFDDAVGIARRFAERDGSTLVVVTADHETGGYAIVGGSLKDSTVTGKFSTGGHTATMVPLFSFGPGSEQFSGILENAEIGKRLQAVVRGTP
jgi:alkaline phosphatase